MPLNPSPLTWAPSIRTLCAGMAGQVAKATEFTFPKGTMVLGPCPCPSRPCTPRAGPRGSDQRAASLLKRGSQLSVPTPAKGVCPHPSSLLPSPSSLFFPPSSLLPLEVCLPSSC